MNKILTLIILLSVVACEKDPMLDISDNVASRSEEVYDAIYIAPNGDDAADGSITSPVRSIERALSLGKELILIREGEYRFDQTISEINRDVTIKAYPSERVVVSGLEDVTTEWSLSSGNIYVTEPNITPWQIFVDSQMLNAARTPNVNGFIEQEQPLHVYPIKNSLWDAVNSWYSSDESSTNGNMVATGDCHFDDLPYSVQGAIAVLNVGSWKTSYADITSHVAGSQTFRYDNTMSDQFLSWIKPHHAKFYIEGKLELLDTPGEWFYDVDKNRLYIYCKDGQSPAGRVQGKTQSYAIKIFNSSRITLSDIEFRGTTIYAEKSSNLEVSNCKFYYPSCSRRMLREDPQYINTTLFNGCTSVLFTNNVVKYSEGEAVAFAKTPTPPNDAPISKTPDVESRALLKAYGGHMVSNNLFQNIDFSCANIRSIGASVVLFGTNCSFVGNTMCCTGASEGVINDELAYIAYNEVYSTGHLQSDGAVFQMMQPTSMNTTITGNWVHDTIKHAIRVDGDERNAGQEEWIPGDNMTKAVVTNNTLWNCRGMQIKGDYHLIVNNTLFGKVPDSSDPTGYAPTALTISCTPVMGLEHANKNTYTFNNLADLITSHYTDEKKWDKYPLPESVFNNYVAYYTDNNIVTDVMMDYENLDFRPIYLTPSIIDSGVEPTLPPAMDDLEYEKGTEDNPLDMGAYEYNDENYVISGRCEGVSSSPIPADGSASDASVVMLAWKPAWQSNYSAIYIGTNYRDVESATTSDPEYMGATKGACYYPKKSAYPFTKRNDRYYWRVDCMVDGKIVKGDVWVFYPPAKAI